MMLRILHLEDNPLDAELVRQRLITPELVPGAGASRAPDELMLDFTLVDSQATFEAALAQGGWRLILADYELPSYDGLSALAAAQVVLPEVPFIFVTGELSEERAVELLQLGATDYVLKTNLKRLRPAVVRALREADLRAERAREQAAAAAEREWLRVTLASIGDAVIATDTAGRVTFMNPVAEALTGWTQAEAAGQPASDVFRIVNERTRASVASPIERVLREGNIVGLANHTLLLARDGSEIPIDDSGAPIRDETGQTLGVVLVFRDIRERKAAEEALSASEERYRSLVETHSAIVWRADAGGRFAEPQPQWEAYTGQAWPAYRGAGWLEMIHPDDRSAVADGWQAAVAKGESFEVLGRLWNAQSNGYCFFEARGAPLRGASGQLREWVGTFADVNERKLAEAAARESESRFRILADTAPVMVWMSDPTGGVDYFSRSWLEFTGRPPEQEFGQGWLEGVHPDDRARVQQLDAEATAERQPLQLEYRLRRHDGQYRWVIDLGVPRFAPEGEFLGFIGSALDIHARKTAETALAIRARQQAEVAALGQQALAGGHLQGLLDTAVRVVAGTLEVKFCKLLELLPDGQALLLRAGVGWQPGLVSTATVGAGLDSQAGFTLQAAEPVIVHDLRHEARFHGPALLTDHGVISGLSVIVGGPRGPWGVLGAHTAEPREFTPDDINFVQSVANVLGEALARAAAEDALRAARDQIAAILEGVAEGVTVQDAAGRLVYANDAAAWLLGYPNGQALAAAPVTEILGRFVVLNEDGSPFPLGNLPGRRVLQGEPEAAITVRFRVVATGEERWSAVSARPIRNAAGQPALAVNIFHDITELKRGQLAQRLLADAGELVAGQLDEAELMGGLARLAVPDLADYSLAYLAEPGDQARCVGHAHRDPLLAGLLATFAETYHPTPEHPGSLVGRVMRSGEPLLTPAYSEGHLQGLPQEAARLLARLGPRSALTVPLLARQRLLGVLVLVRTGNDPYDTADLSLAQELARRSALALDNARLFGEAQQLNIALEERVQERTEELHVAMEQLQESNAELEIRIQERQQAEARFRGLLQSAPDAIVITDRQGRIVLANARTEALFGYPPEALVGQAVELLLPERYAKAHRAHRANYVREPRARPMGRDLALFGRHRDGHEFPVEITLSPLADPDGLLVTSIIRDVSERQAAEARVRQSEQRLAEAQAIAGLGSWHWDVRANVVTWSDELYRIYGRDPRTFAATFEGFLEAVHPDDRDQTRNVITHALQARQPFEFDHRIVRPDGEVRALHARGEVTLDEAGAVVAMTGIGHDVTDYRRIEAQLRLSREQLRQLSGRLEAMREDERTRISREIHDELGGALTGLKMDLARLSKHAATLTPDAVRARAQEISTLVDGTVKTVRRIATDLRPGILDDFGLAAAIEWQLQEFEQRAGIECVFLGDAEDLALAPQAATALFRILQETLTNVARHAEARHVEVRLESTAQGLVLEVQDDGRGIAPAEVEGSRSLGLLGMRERVRLLAGRLEIEGQPERGTRVRVTVPLNDAADQVA
jgi:PAS domain S-box-containing protein